MFILQEGNPWGDHSTRGICWGDNSTGGISWGDNSTSGSAGVTILQVIQGFKLFECRRGDPYKTTMGNFICS